MIRALSVFGPWGWLDLFGGLLVVVGCIGESWILLNKSTKQIEAQGKRLSGTWRVLIVLEAEIRTFCIRLNILGWDLNKAKEHLLEVLFVVLVALGVGMELVSIPFSLWESAGVARKAEEAKERAEELVSTNLVLRADVVKLESSIAPRRLTGDQKTRLVSLLNVSKLTVPKSRYPTNWIPGVFVVSAWQDPEASDFADDFIEAFQKAGWNAWTNRMLLDAKFGLRLKTVPSAPPDLPGLQELRTSLRLLKIPHDEAPIVDAEKGTFGHSNLQTTAIYFFIEHKPLPAN